MASFKVRNLSDEFSFGSIVDGMNWDVINDPAACKDLNTIFEDRGLIVFKNCEDTSAMHVGVSKVFGPLKDHPTKTTPRAVDTDIAPGVIDMHYKPSAAAENGYGGTVRIAGKDLVRYSPWHFDHCYNNELNYAGVLRAPMVPPHGEGGRTGFLDGIELYQAFDPKLRAKIESLNIIYTLDTRMSEMRFGRPKDFYVYPETGPMTEGIVREASIFPRAMHPAVWTRRTGEKVLHVGPWMAFGVEHHEDAEGEALFEEVCQEVNRKAHGYWHTWNKGDLVLWDNWRMLHAVEGNDPKHERRTQRTTIKGDYGLGYFEHGKKIGEVNRKLTPVPKVAAE
jgi:taurine dioxygenase